MKYKSVRCIASDATKSSHHKPLHLKPESKMTLAVSFRKFLFITISINSIMVFMLVMGTSLILSVVSSFLCSTFQILRQIGIDIQKGEAIDKTLLIMLYTHIPDSRSNVFATAAYPLLRLVQLAHELGEVVDDFSYSLFRHMVATTIIFSGLERKLILTYRKLRKAHLAPLDIDLANRHICQASTPSYRRLARMHLARLNINLANRDVCQERLSKARSRTSVDTLSSATVSRALRINFRDRTLLTTLNIAVANNTLLSPALEGPNTATFPFDQLPWSTSYTFDLAIQSRPDLYPHARSQRVEHMLMALVDPIDCSPPSAPHHRVWYYSATRYRDEWSPFSNLTQLGLGHALMGYWKGVDGDVEESGEVTEMSNERFDDGSNSCDSSRSGISEMDENANMEDTVWESLPSPVSSLM